MLADPFVPDVEIAAFGAAHRESGGIVTFLGQVRGEGAELLELRHYEPLTLPGMRELAATCETRWRLDGLLILHRTGEMGPGEPIVLVAAAAPHRAQAFAAADYAMDHLKSESWFWKRERRGGAWRWIEPRAEDYAAKSRWS
ncbi:MAG: molybdenum cofactor biosynthesis protein MoaE [Novosphingobium sp.]